MGFFKKLIRMFQNAIECPDKYSNDLFYIAPLKRRTIKLGATLFVRENYIAVLVVKNKVTDTFIEGKHKLILGAMPNTARRVNFKSRNKDKKPKDKFRGEVYFINLNLFEGEFAGIEAFLLKDEKLGKVKVRANGTFSYYVENAKKFLEVCFLNWAYLKPQTVTKKISFWVMEETIKQVENLNPPLLEFAKNNPYLCERVVINIEKKFLTLGIQIKNYKITETFVPGKFVEKLEEALDDDKSILENDYEKGTAYIKRPYNEIDVELEDDLTYEQMSSYSPYDDVSYGGNVKKERMNDSNILIDEPTIFKNNYKICDVCNTSLAKDALACYNCGQKQTKKRLCPSCNMEVESGEFVCPNCRNIII